jgi:hypothetical protein
MDNSKLQLPEAYCCSKCRDKGVITRLARFDLGHDGRRWIDAMSFLKCGSENIPNVRFSRSRAGFSVSCDFIFLVGNNYSYKK